jgi:ribosomal protein S18 acetylase RimI-like enzyme
VAEAEHGQKAESGLVGLAHFRAMPSPLRGAEIGFLDDLFVDPACRGGGAGDQLLRHLDNIAAARGWPVMRWITQDNNYRARGLYDQLALRTGWITYEMNAETTGRPDR